MQYVTNPHIIPDDENVEEANNVFCYAALADKNKRTLYTDATGALPVRSLDGNQYYIISYDYELNHIFATPVPDLTDESIIGAFEDVFGQLKAKGYKPQFNVTDNQAAAAIKRFMKKEDCEHQFVEPTNHRVNASERAIQTFKNHHISGLCTTDPDWPLQLWDKMTEQSVITLNILRPSRIDPTKSAYHQFHGKRYDWNAHPMAPPGTKAIIYLDPKSRTSWGARGLDAWYCGPALDHYRNCVFYVPATKSYRTSASFDLFPQHCQLPTLNQEQHAEEVYDELIGSIKGMKRKQRNKIIAKMQKSISILSTATPEYPIERVIEDNDGSINSEGERPIQRVAVTAPPITTSTNPTEPRTLQANKPYTHTRTTRANTPGQLPAIVRDDDAPTTALRRSKRLNPENVELIRPIQSEPNSHRIPMAQHHIVSQEALNSVIEKSFYDPNAISWTPEDFITANPNQLPTQSEEATNTMDVDIEHFCAGVVHSVTGETITSYKKLIKDALYCYTWETAFGKEFGNIAQGDDRTGEKGTNCVFVMTHEEIANIPRDRVVTYARIVIDYRPQKDDPNRVRITAGGNLIDCPMELTTRTADLTTSKILWNSVLSTEDAKCMCIDVKSFYLCTPMDRYEYMKMPLSIFPEHTRKQYDLDSKAKNGFVYLEIRKAIYGLPQGGILANKLLRKRLAPHGYYEVAHTPGLWRHVTRPVQFTLVVDDFCVKYTGKEHADHLIATLKKWYKISEDWDGGLYCGITLKWNYDSKQSIPGDINARVC